MCKLSVVIIFGVLIWWVWCANVLDGCLIPATAWPLPPDIAGQSDRDIFNAFHLTSEWICEWYNNKYRKWRIEGIIRSFFLYFVPSLRRAARCLSRYLFCIWWGSWKLGAGIDNQQPTLSILRFRGRWRNAIMGEWESCDWSACGHVTPWWAVIGQDCDERWVWRLI